MRYVDRIVSWWRNRGRDSVGRQPNNTDPNLPSHVPTPTPEPIKQDKEAKGFHDHAQLLFNFLLVVFAAGALWVASKQKDITSTQTNIQSRQADISANQLALENAADVASAADTAATRKIQQDIADATANQASAMNTTAAAEKRQAEAAAAQVAAAQKQLEQNRELVAFQQQPEVGVDLAKEQTDFHNDLVPDEQAVAFTYPVKNSGRSTAYNVWATEELTLFGRTERKRSFVASRIEAGQEMFATAKFHVRPGDTAKTFVPQKIYIRHDYTDQFGRKLHNVFCRVLFFPGGEGNYHTC